MSQNRHNRNRSAAPAGRPQDHTPPLSKERTVTVKGVTVTLDPSKLDDWELMESLYDLQSDPEGNSLSVIPFLRGLFSPEDYRRVKESLRDPGTGRITGTAMGGFLKELFERLNDAFPNS
ncbi:hypothetical protein [Bifidobacterium olomucense]|uniref:Uncharacterized protein n=1 Tax=Bifidobacterium olomucense TaxID=2675324 RepID=A0A7Y0F1H3_9BIFI|nr:hypothetical protein [Bifidobacterium sp. DSM 109959]NMM99326.1 hypothetical protein [Bifidobacterium sp. DSM 109959]